MTAVIGIRRLGLAVAALVVAGFVALVIVSFLMPAETVREAVKAEIRAVTGLDPVLRGGASVSLFPTGTVRFDDVSLGERGDGGPGLTAEHVVARLRFFPFLIGRIEIADVSLVRPTISVVFNADRSSNWSGHIEALARHLQPGDKRTSSFSEIRIEDGTFILRDEAHKIVETLSNVEFALAWPSISKSFAGTGHFSWNNEVLDTTISFTDFAAALRGDRSGLKIRLAGAPLKLAFDGYLSHRPTLKMEGTLAADAASLRETLRWAGQQILPGGGFGRFALKAQANVVGSTLGLSGVNIELDGNAGEGVLTLANGGRQTLQGTLAADTLDLTPYVSTVRLLTTGQRDWDRQPITLDGLKGIDVDLRLSAARVNVAHVRLGRTAVAATVRGGNLNVTIGEAQAFGGVLKGSFGIARAQAAADFKAQLQFADVDLERCLGELLGLRRLEGKGTLAFALDSSGSNIYELTKALNGTANLTGRKGALSGFNIEQLLRRFERRPLSGGGEVRGGKTPYETLTVNVKISQGIAAVEEVRMEGPSVRIALGGAASIPSRQLDLKGTASLLSSLAGSTTAAAPAFELPFIVEGPWDEPLMWWDVQSRIQRSAPAQSVLDAMRNRPPGDPIRSAIERLTGRAPPEAAPAAADAERPPPAAPALAGATSAPATENAPATSEPDADTAQSSR